MEDLVVGHSLAAGVEVHTDTSSHFTEAFTDIGFGEGSPYKLVAISTTEDTTGTVKGSLEQEASATDSIFDATPCFSTFQTFASPKGQPF